MYIRFIIVFLFIKALTVFSQTNSVFIQNDFEKIEIKPIEQTDLLDEKDLQKETAVIIENTYNSIPEEKTDFEETKQLKKIIGVKYGYLRAKGSLNAGSFKSDNVPLMFFGKFFTSETSSLKFEVFKVSGDKLNNRYVSPMNASFTYSTYYTRAQNSFNAGFGINYYDNGIRSDHHGIQRHSLALYLALGLRTEFGKNRAIEFNIKNSPYLSYTIEHPRKTSYSANTSYFHISSSFEFPSIIIPATLSINISLDNYYNMFKTGNVHGKFDNIFFLGFGLSKSF